MVWLLECICTNLLMFKIFSSRPTLIFLCHSHSHSHQTPNVGNCVSSPHTTYLRPQTWAHNQITEKTKMEHPCLENVKRHSLTTKHGNRQCTTQAHISIFGFQAMYRPTTDLHIWALDNPSTDLHMGTRQCIGQAHISIYGHQAMYRQKHISPYTLDNVQAKHRSPPYMATSHSQISIYGHQTIFQCFDVLVKHRSHV